MRKNLTSIIGVLGICMSLVSITGCSNEKEYDQKVSLAIVEGVHSNAGQIPFNSDTIYEYLYQTAYTQGEITLIANDGNPEVVYHAVIPPLEVDGLSETKKKSIAQAYVMQLQGAMTEVSADETEVNTLESIKLAAQALSDEEGDRVLLVLDSGVQTTGYLNMNEDILYADPEVISEWLKNEHALPNLQGISVVWSFCGETAMPQKKLSDDQQFRLKVLWEKILLNGGAESVTFTTDFSGEAYVGLPEVSCVSTEPSSSAPVPIDTILIDESMVNFYGDTAQFIDKTSTYTILSSVAEELLKHPENEVYVIGTTASAVNRTEEFCQKLSEDRAEAVRNALIRCGVPKDQMTAIGLSYHDPWHENDVDENGNLNEEIAIQNRKVLILDRQNYQP